MARRAPEIPLRLFVALLAAIVVVGKVGEAVAPILLARNSPILLLLLNANDINLVLTTAQCETRVATWAAVATLRRVAEDATYYFFARAHGARATAFARDRLGLDLAKAERSLQTLSLAALVVAPGAPVCLLAGLSVSARVFLLTSAASTAARVLVAYLGARHASQLVERALALVSDHVWLAGAATTALALAGAAPLLRLWRRTL